MSTWWRLVIQKVNFALVRETLFADQRNLNRQRMTLLALTRHRLIVQEGVLIDIEIDIHLLLRHQRG